MDSTAVKVELPGEIIEQIIVMYLQSDANNERLFVESHEYKCGKVAFISKAYRDLIRRARFSNLTVGYPSRYIPSIATLLLNSSNAAAISSEIAWTKKNHVDINYVSYYVNNLFYTDSIELVKLFLVTVPNKCLTYVRLDLKISSKFAKKAPASYLHDLACFLWTIESAPSYFLYGDMNTLRFHSNRMLETIKVLRITLKGPRRARKDYISETVDDIVKCINCSILFMDNSSLITSSIFRKLTMQLTRMSLDGCPLLEDDDFAWFFTSNNTSLTHFSIEGHRSATLKTWQALSQCLHVIEIRFCGVHDTPVPFKLIARAAGRMLNLKTLTVESSIIGASEEAVLDIMLRQSHGGVLDFVYLNKCIGLYDYRAMKKSLIKAYKRTLVWIKMSLNGKTLVCKNPELSTYINGS